jgi:hypothetical protein
MKAMKNSMMIAACLAVCVAFGAAAQAQTDPFPSWNEGPTKAAVVDFVKATTTAGAPGFVPIEARIATFDQDGTLWVEHPMYAQLMYCLDRVPLLTGVRELVRYLPGVEDLRSANPNAVADLSKLDLEIITVAKLSGMTTDVFAAEAGKWYSR